MAEPAESAPQLGRRGRTTSERTRVLLRRWLSYQDRELNGREWAAMVRAAVALVRAVTGRHIEPHHLVRYEIADNGTVTLHDRPVAETGSHPVAVWWLPNDSGQRTLRTGFAPLPWPATPPKGYGPLTVATRIPRRGHVGARQARPARRRSSRSTRAGPRADPDLPASRSPAPSRGWRA